MTVWGGEQQHELVGVNVFTDSYTASTPHINVYADWYCESNNWPFSDNQTLTISGSTSGTFNFAFNTGSGVASQYIGRTTIYNQGQSYGGGPTYHFHGALSGQYLGGTPYVDYYWALPGRPASVPGPPGVAVSSVTSNSCVVSVSAGASNGSAINDYYAEVSLPGPSWSGSTAGWHGSGAHTVTGLTPATVYQARAKEHNSVGDSAYAYTSNFTTGATAPGVPTGLASSAVNQTTATVSWNAPGSDGGSAINGYDLQLATDSGFSANLQTISYSASPANLTGLTPGVKYYARVRSSNAVGDSAWTASINFTMLAGTPTIIAPAAGTTYTDAAARVVISALGIASDRTITAQLSQDSTFATGVITLTLNPGSASANNQYTLQDTTQYLKTGTWYARAQVKNNTSGYITPWSTTVSWTESHAPSASTVSPISGKTWQYTPNVTFTWSFGDAAGSSDAQTAYQVVVEDNLNGTSIYDSGKVASAVTSLQVPIDASLKNQQLRWRVKVWDKGDTASAWTAYSVFTLADVPVVNLQTPANGGTVDNGSPTFSWGETIPSGGTQATAVIVVTETDTAKVVWNYTVNGSATSATPPVVILGNQHNYSWTVTVTDSTGLQGSATGSFSTSYSAPNSIQYDVDASGAEELGYVLVDWSQALPDDAFAAWKVYRQDVNDLSSGWELLAQVSDVNTRQWYDYMLVAGKEYIYSVTQVATRSGALLESTVGYFRNDADVEQTENRVVDVDLVSYWIINPNDTSQSVRLPVVIADDSTYEQETSTYTIIDRGRHTDYGTDLGYTGTLKCQVRKVERPSTFRQTLEDLYRAKETYWLRTPFGRLFMVSLGNLGWSPVAGVGTAEMGDMTIPYEEVR